MDTEMRIWISVIALCYIAMFIGGIAGFTPLMIAGCAVMVGFGLRGAYIHASRYVRDVILNR